METFFNAEEMFSANQLMNSFIKEQLAGLYEQKVKPNVKPGFLRRKLPDSPPQTGKCIEGLLDDTKAHIMPGIMNWQSPKYFGYFPGSINITTPMVQMFTSSFHSPGFNFAVAPTYTQLENIMMDWCVQALGLPEKFLLKNEGGGIIGNNVTESVMLSINAAKYRAMKRLDLSGDNPIILKFVGYFSEQCHPGAERALRLKDIFYRRVVPCTYNPKIMNFELDLEAFATILKDDIQQGLIPLWFGLTYGSTFSAAIELSEEALQLCKSYNMWVNIDAAYLGPTWISEKYRPKKELLERVDSIAINFLKLLMLSPGGSVFFVADKTEYVEAMGGKSDFSFYKNEYSDNYDVIDYKDWSIGLVRRNYAIHFFYFFSHFGIDKIREAVEQLQERIEYFEELLLQRGDLFEVRFKAYSLISFQLTASTNANALTKRLGAAVCNTDEGFCTPSDFKGQEVIRVVIGNFHTSNEHILSYFNKIVDEAEALLLSTQEEI